MKLTEAQFNNSYNRLRSLPEGRGEKSEENLVDSINSLVKQGGGKVKLRMGRFGNRTVTGAFKPGGTPKTDVLVHTTKGDLGISLKMPSADFLDNRRTELQVTDMIDSFHGNEQVSDFIVGAIRSFVEQQSDDHEDIANAENRYAQALIRKFVPAAKKSYKISWSSGIDGRLDDGVSLRDYKDDRSKKGFAAVKKEFYSKFKKKETGIVNYQLRLSDFFGEDAYKAIMAGLLGGPPPQDPSNDYNANAYFRGEIKRPNYTAKELNEVFNAKWQNTLSLTTIPDAADVLMEFYDPRIRVRAITPARAAISDTNTNHYNKGYVDPDSGLSWTTFFITGKPQ